MIVTASKSDDSSNPWRWSHDPYAFGEPGSGYWRLNVRGTWRPPTDVYETEEAIIVRIEIAGMHETDFIIALDGRTLSIRGVRADPYERRAYHQMEIRFGEFGVEMELPFPILADQVEATYRDGFLRLVLPKATPKQIHIDE